MGSSDVGIDLRKFPRVSEDCDVKFSLVDEDHNPTDSTAVAMNISGGGMCFATDDPLDIGQMIAVRVNLPNLPSTVVALAKVVWAKPNARTGRCDNGVEFWWIGWSDNQAQDSMLDYVRAKLDD